MNSWPLNIGIMKDLVPQSYAADYALHVIIFSVRERFRLTVLILALNRPMPHNLHTSNLRNQQISTTDLDTVPVLRVGDSAVAEDAMLAGGQIDAVFLGLAHRFIYCTSLHKQQICSHIRCSFGGAQPEHARPTCAAAPFICRLQAADEWRNKAA
jgi:hypothetical protein